MIWEMVKEAFGMHDHECGHKKEEIARLTRQIEIAWTERRAAALRAYDAATKASIEMRRIGAPYVGVIAESAKMQKYLRGEAER